MAASLTDKITDTYNAQNPNVARVTGTRVASGTTLTCDNLAGWPTASKVHFSTYQVNTSGTYVAGSQIDWSGLVTSSTTIGSLTRLTGATDSGSSVGDYVEMNPTAKWAQDLSDALILEHGRTGIHALTSNSTLTSSKFITSLNDTNGNELFKVTPTASAVNEFTVANAATGNAPVLSVTSSSDSNADLRLAPLGTGNVKRGASGGAIDWWEELGRTTLGVAGDTISVASISARKYLQIRVHAFATGGNILINVRFNNDSAANYTRRVSINGAAEVADVSQTELNFSTAADAGDNYVVLDVINVSAREKVVTGHSVNRPTAGAANSVARGELTGKWANTSAQITRVDVVNTSTGDFAIGSEVVVLGHD
jgi:hypothetical protein